MSSPLDSLAIVRFSIRIVRSSRRLFRLLGADPDRHILFYLSQFLEACGHLVGLFDLIQFIFASFLQGSRASIRLRFVFVSASFRLRSSFAKATIQFCQGPEWLKFGGQLRSRFVNYTEKRLYERKLDDDHLTPGKIDFKMNFLLIHFLSADLSASSQKKIFRIEYFSLDAVGASHFSLARARPSLRLQ
jgi:hypothetical protein